MDKKDYEFTGQTSGEAGGADIDDVGQYYQHPEGTNFDSMDKLDGSSGEADRAIQREVNSCRGDGFNTDNRMSELQADCPGQLEAGDLTEPNYIEEIPGSEAQGEYQQRQWKDSDNTGGDGVPSPEMPVFYEMPKLMMKKPY